MNKTEREEARESGYTILRPQWDQRKQVWRIVKYSNAGGWIATGFQPHMNCAGCEKAIDRLIDLYPEQYKKD